jgi:hypothetical protein
MAVIRGGQKLEAQLRLLGNTVAKKATLRVGFLENAKYPDGTPVAMIAAIQDFGAPKVGIPPRPFFRNMIRQKQREWGPAIARLLRTNNFDAEKALEFAGQAIAGQLRQSIQDTNTPPLKPATIRRKGFAKPLVDTGQMLNSVDYEVKT